MAATPYPVNDMGMVTPSSPPPTSPQKQSNVLPKARSPPPKAAASQEGLHAARISGLVASPRFNIHKHMSLESVSTNDIPELGGVQKARRLASPDLRHASSLSLPQIDSHTGHVAASPMAHASHSHSSSSHSNSHVRSPSYAHHRSISSTLSILYDRGDAVSISDFNQNHIQQHLGASAGSHLLPRMKTIELYRKNAKKSSDPAVLFQYAQYMLQTALILEEPAPEASTDSLKPADKLHRKNPSGSSVESASNPNLRLSLLKEALHYLKRLSDKGYVEAQYLLGDAYSSGAFGKVDNKEAFNLFLSAAKRGHTECAFRTAHCYEEGLGTGRDSRKGIDFLKMAASKNHPAAMYKLGIYFFYSRMGVADTQVNKKLGIKWLERALNVATELTSAAPYELGKIYLEGFSDILIKDERYALELFVQAAALGHVEASAILGRHYEVGEIVDEDANLLIHYYTKAAFGGHAASMLAMCAWYMVGLEPNLPKDDHEAFEWAKRSASCGFAKAQFVLANFYDKGIGCDADPQESQKWYIKAAENGQEKALARIKDKQIVATLTKNQKKGRKLTAKKSVSDLSAQEKDCVIM